MSAPTKLAVPVQYPRMKRAMYEGEVDELIQAARVIYENLTHGQRQRLRDGEGGHLQVPATFAVRLLAAVEPSYLEEASDDDV